MAVAFKSQTAVAYESTSTIQWYGETVIGYIQQHFVKAIDFTFKANQVDYTQVASMLSQQFEVLLENFNFPTKAVNFDFEVEDTDYTQSAKKIDHTKGLT